MAIELDHIILLVNDRKNSSMARLLVNSQRPDRPSVRCIGVARLAPGAQPTLSRGTGRPSSLSHFCLGPANGLSTAALAKDGYCRYNNLCVSLMTRPSATRRLLIVGSISKTPFSCSRASRSRSKTSVRTMLSGGSFATARWKAGGGHRLHTAWRGSPHLQHEESQ